MKYAIFQLITVIVTFAETRPQSNLQSSFLPVPFMKDALSKQRIMDAAADDFIDNLVYQLQEDIYDENLDPHIVQTVDLENIHTEGAIYGLSTIHRSNKSSTVIKTDTRVVIQTTLEVDNLRSEFDVWLCVGHLNISGSVVATADKILVPVFLRGNADGANPIVLHIGLLHISKIGHINVSVHGMGPIDKYVDVIASAVTNTLKYIVKKFVDKPLTIHVQKFLNNNPFLLPDWQ